MTYYYNAEDTCLNNQTPSERSSGTSLGSAAGLVPDVEKSPAAALDYGGVPVTRHVSTLDFPEGGMQAWLVVLGSFCAMLSVYGVINTAAVFESYFATHQLAAYSPSDIGWIFSLYLFVVFFVGIQVGPIFDRYGPRLVVALGGVLIASSLLLLSFCQGKCCLSPPISPESQLTHSSRVLPDPAHLLRPRRPGRRTPQLARLCGHRSLLQPAPRPGHRHRCDSGIHWRHRLPHPPPAAHPHAGFRLDHARPGLHPARPRRALQSLHPLPAAAAG